MERKGMMLPRRTIERLRAENAAEPLLRRRRRWILAGLALLALAAFGFATFPGLKARAEAGAAYGARVGCSCLFVQGRSIESCTRDFEPGMERITLTRDDEAKSATASFPLLAARTARFMGASGCILEPKN